MEPKLNCATSTIKYLLFFFNFIFLIGGLAILVIGSIIITGISNYDAFLSDPFAAPGILLVTTGAIIVVTGFLGCCGAIRQSFWMLIGFACCMSIIFILQLVGGILAFVFQDELDVLLKNEMEDQMKLYDDPENGEMSKLTWDRMQIDFQCCGVETYSDWLAIAGIDPPETCKCSSENTEICNPVGFFKKGCYYSLKDYFVTIQTALGVVALVFSAVELVGVAFALIVAYSIKRNYNLPAYSGRPASHTRRYSTD